MDDEEKNGKLAGAIFDWDGTLASIDDREFYCINHALVEHGTKPVSRDFYVDNYYRRAYELGTGPRMVLDTALAGRDSGLSDQVYESYRKIFQATVDKAVLQPGSLETLRALKGIGLKIGVATMRYTRWVVESELQRLAVAPFVDLLKTRQDLGVKGALGSLEETVNQRTLLVTKELAELGLNSRSVFLTGDSWWDIRAGKQLGIKTVLVKTGFASFNDFSQENPDLTIASLSQLLENIKMNGWTD